MENEGEDLPAAPGSPTRSTASRARGYSPSLLRTPSRPTATHARATPRDKGGFYSFADPFKAPSLAGSSTAVTATPVSRRSKRRRTDQASQASAATDTNTRVGGPDQLGLPVADQRLYIWGVNVDVEVFKRKVKMFLNEWPPTEKESYYLRAMDRMFTDSRPLLDIDLADVRAYTRPDDPDIGRWLYDVIAESPDEVMPLMDAAANAVYTNRMAPQLRAEQAETDMLMAIAVRPFGLATVHKMRELGKEQLDQLVCVKGMVVRVSRRHPELDEAVFMCTRCGSFASVRADRGKIDEPARCEDCGSLGSLDLQHNQSVFVDKQYVRLQEAPESTPDGQTPASIQVTLDPSLIDAFVPGDRVLLTGIFTAKLARVKANARQSSTVHKTFVRAVHMVRTARGRSQVSLDHGVDDDDGDRDMVDRIGMTARRADIYDVLRRSFAPGIWGHSDVKMGLLCQLFGGSRKEFKFCSARAEINILLCGDPGVAKSQMVTHTHAIASRGIYTSGKGSSSVGLTAYVVRDGDTGEFVLESGALVLSDQGVCCIDEFDKMDDGTRAVLHEVMEQQTVSIARAGIICSLNARASVLAAANPKGSKWQRSLNIIENISIGPTLLSRFDLVYLLLDEHDVERDRRLAGFLCQMYRQTPPPEAEAPEPTAARDHGDLVEGSDGSERMSSANLTKYIHHAKQHCRPIMTPEASKYMVDAYLQLRKSRGSRNVVTATVRQLESMIRLAEALAKMRLSDSVEAHDVTEAKRLTETALRDSCIDKNTGCLITTAAEPGTGMSLTSIVGWVEKIVRQDKLVGKTVTVTALQTMLREHFDQGISQANLLHALELMVSREQATLAENACTFRR